jgi:hypothetical protein
MRLERINAHWYAVMREQVEREKVWIQLHETNKEIWESLKKKPKQIVDQALLTMQTISSSEFSEEKKEHLLGTTKRNLDSNLSRLRNGLVRYLFVTAASIADGKIPLGIIAESQVISYEEKSYKRPRETRRKINPNLPDSAIIPSRDYARPFTHFGDRHSKRSLQPSLLSKTTLEMNFYSWTKV